MAIKSVLITPGTRLDRYRGTRNIPADAVMFDLEDAVPANEKSAARRHWQTLTETTARERTCVRINSFPSMHSLHDLACVLSSEVKPDLVFVPKAESAQCFRMLDELLDDAGVVTGLVALIETPRGVASALEISASSRRLKALAFGAADYSMALGTGMEWDLMLHARWSIVNAAKASELQAIDSPSFDLRDQHLLRQDCERANKMGFTGKFAVHPKQVATINEVFRPDPAAISWATRVVQAAGASATSIATLDGSMIGPPFLRRAQNILAAMSSPS
ncbi:CoA ester lyase [Neorhizobium sp. BT27B]|uniref:HpcH/HpaI aldolase/citrate lyase family protein n=1 Tax=Neorhizobium sp. BT27B TaxID=3142625 RepID=UPI003D292AB3